MSPCFLHTVSSNGDVAERGGKRIPGSVTQLAYDKMGFEGAEDVASGSGVGGGGVAGVAGNNRQQQQLEMRYERNRLVSILRQATKQL